MSSTPKWKCYLDGKYLAACKHADDAAALMSAWSGGQVKYDHRHLVWTEGEEDFPAGESYDRAADIMIARKNKLMGEFLVRSKARFNAALEDIYNRPGVTRITKENDNGPE